MTKAKAPASIDAALGMISGQFPNGWADMAAIVDRHPATVYGWANPEGEQSIPLDCAIKLVVAYRRAGGTGDPILAAYKAQLAIAEAEDGYAIQDDIAAITISAVKEDAEATAATIACTRPDATAECFRTAIRETEESIVVRQRSLASLKRGAGLIGGERPPGEGTGK